MQPWLSQAHQGVSERCDNYALSIADGSAVNFGKHKSKADKKQRTHKYDIGYERQTSLLLSDRNGEPLAPIVQNWVTKDGVWSSYHDERIRFESHLEELTRRMAWIEAQEFCKPVVHLIDREAASIAHQRQWDQAGHWLVLRDKAGSHVVFDNREMKRGEVADTLTYQAIREVLIKGKKAKQWVAEAQITVTRRAKPKKYIKGRRVKPIAGKALTLRLIVSRIIDDAGYVQAEWLLLSNVKTVSAETIALWYYWRWRIESFFK